MDDEPALDTQIMQQHQAGNTAALADLYYGAALLCEHDDNDRYCFLLTNAYVCALEAGSQISRDIHARLAQHGREA